MSILKSAMARRQRHSASGAFRLLELMAISSVVAACAGGPKPTGPVPQGVALPVQPPALQQEFRGVWIATVNNIDWPSKRGLSTDSMKKELLALIDRAAQLHFNAIVFQVRPAGDALYKSSIEPWSPFITGTMGKAPDGDFDPLAFVVKESHARGMQVHAWFNPYRAGFVNDRWQPSADHVSKKHPEWVRKYGSFYWMDPGDPKVREYSLSVFRDVAKRYDVDGIHIDDYFYPYVEKDSAKKDIPFPDDATYKAYQLAGGKLDRSDWRRENVNKLVKGMAEVVHQVKPWVLVGVSPIGVYRPGIPAGAGFDAYESIYCDSKKWLNEAWVDYYVPQLYYLRTAKAAYEPVMKWWVSENTKGRHLWIGNFTTRVGTQEGWTVDELVQQIQLTRQSRGATGNVHFSAKFLYGTTPVAEAMRTGPYAEPALVPASPWLGSAKANAAPRLETTNLGSDVAVRILPGDKAPVRFWVVRYYDGTRWLSDIVGGETNIVKLPAGLEHPFWVVVSGVGRTGVEGAFGAVKVQ